MLSLEPAGYGVGAAAGDDCALERCDSVLSFSFVRSLSFKWSAVFDEFEELPLGGCGFAGMDAESCR